jgi:hypothetical protein
MVNQIVVLRFAPRLSTEKMTREDVGMRSSLPASTASITEQTWNRRIASLTPVTQLIPL